MKSIKAIGNLKKNTVPYSNGVGIFLKDKKTDETLCLVRWIDAYPECIKCKWYGFSCAGYTEKSKDYMICSGIKR